MKSEYLLKQAGISPATAAILSAGVGGGLGYLLDRWKEHSGEEVENKWLRPVTFGAIASLPAIAMGAARHSYDVGPAGNHGLPFLKRWFMDNNTFWRNSPYAIYNLRKRNEEVANMMSDEYQSKRMRSKGASLREKRSYFGLPPINVNDFNQQIWADASRGQTPTQSAGFVSNTLNQTSNSVGSNLVTPGQVINTMLNAGIGYGTAWLAGKTLGALAGVSPETQEKLQEIGAWGGMMRGIGNAIAHQ